MSREDFHGSKVALFYKQQVLLLRRDDIPTIEYPDYWDFPGGGREGLETPEQCVLRELFEEFGLKIAEERLTYKRVYSSDLEGRAAVFFVGKIYKEEINSIKLGDEGQYWKLMDVECYLVDAKSIPRHVQRLNDYLASDHK